MNSGEKGEGRIEEKTISNHNLFYTVDKLVTSAFKTNANITPNTTHTETTYTHMLTHTHIRMQTQTHAFLYKLVHANTPPCMFTLMCTHTLTHSHMSPPI